MIQINAVSEFLQLVEKLKRAEERAKNYSDFVFRGQPIDKPLLPKLGRLQTKGEVASIEQLMLSEFERMSPPMTELSIHDDWQRIALAQHHGLPTRLLDWTYSALAAVWFAVRETPKRDEQGHLRNGVVWILKTKTADFIKFPTTESPFNGARTRIFRPRVVARRIAAQASLFTVHKLRDGGAFLPLERISQFRSTLVKVEIPAGSFTKLRAQLHACGTNHLTMFPDLDGLGRHIAWRYTWSEGERPRASQTRQL